MRVVVTQDRPDVFWRYTVIGSDLLWRLSYQMKALADGAGRSACGLSKVLYFDPAQKRAWLYAYPERERRWLAGNTLCYYKEVWRKHPFPNLNDGEDTRFVWSLPETAILALADHTFYAATVHRNNTSPKRTNDPRWLPRPIDQIQSMLGHDLHFYETWPAEKSLAVA